MIFAIWIPPQLEAHARFALKNKRSLAYTFSRQVQLFSRQVPQTPATNFLYILDKF